MEDKKFKSIKSALMGLIKFESENSIKTTGRSINDLPEYYLSVKAADFLHNSFKKYTFSMEDSMKEISIDIGIADDDLLEIPRCNGKVDLVVRSQKLKEVRHLIEFKRSPREIGIIKDILRLAAVCLYSPAGHKVETNFMVVIAPVSRKQLENRTMRLTKKLHEEFGTLIKLSANYVDLQNQISTRSASKKKNLNGVIWQVKYHSS